jgi:hypothetical protein
MKWKIILTILAISAINCSFLKREDESILFFYPIDQQKELDPVIVKSPGEFSNVAPESKKIITPEYASKSIFIFRT